MGRQKFGAVSLWRPMRSYYMMGPTRLMEERLAEHKRKLAELSEDVKRLERRLKHELRERTKRLREQKARLDKKKRQHSRSGPGWWWLRLPPLCMLF